MRYSARLDPAPGGGFAISFPEIEIGYSQADTREAAADQAEDLLDEAVLGMMADGLDVPLPVPPAAGGERIAVALPPKTAARLEAYRAMRAAGLGVAEMAGRLGWAPAELARLFDGPEAPPLDRLDAVLRALGRRLVITGEPL